jgi:hypothetical protein
LRDSLEAYQQSPRMLSLNFAEAIPPQDQSIEYPLDTTVNSLYLKQLVIISGPLPAFLKTNCSDALPWRGCLCARMPWGAMQGRGKASLPGA